ncbi:MAG TPA: MFS transporter [Candidatus Limnocylindria bacterium]|nr:MFS transporter [Candidatus Limnocylindria bacterium]
MTGGTWAPERRLLTVALIGLVTAAAFEGMAVPTVLPALVDELGGLDLYGWAFAAFWLTNIIGITLAGIDVDRRGTARSLAIGSLLFSAGMLISGVADGMPQVILGRAVQGFGSGAIGSVVYATIARGYPASATPHMIALISSAWIVPGLVGPALAGAISDAIGWRWVFIGVVPAVLVMSVLLFPLARRMGTVERGDEPVTSDTRRAVDAVLLALGSTVALSGLTIGAPLPAVALVVGGGGIAVWALRHLLPPGSLRLSPGRPAATAAVFAIAFAFFGTEAFVPLTVVELLGGSVTLGGIALSAAAVTWAAGSWLQARASGRGVRRAVVTAGAALIAAGIGIVALVLVPGMPVAVVITGWAVAGLGMGLAYSMLTLLVLETSDRGQEGFSSAALQLMFTLGTAFGAGIGGAIVALADRGVIALSEAVGLVDATMIVVAILAVVVSTRVPRSDPATRHEPTARAIPLEHP